MTTGSTRSTSGRRAPSGCGCRGRRRRPADVDDDARPTTAGGRRSSRCPARRSTTATSSTTTTTPLPDPRSRRQPEGVHARSRTFDPARLRVDRPGRGPAASSPARCVYELHVGTFTPEGTLDAAIDAARPPRRPRRRPRRAAAGQRRQRHPQLGLRRRAVVRRPRAVRRPRGVPALRRRLPTPPASASSRTSSTTTSVRRATTCRCSGPT